MPSLPAELLIGVPSIDREHHELVRHLDRLIYNDNVIPDSAHFSEVFSQLGGLIIKHFNSEETVIRSCGMPLEEIHVHVQAHDAILEQYTQLNDDLMGDKARTMSEIAATMKNWIIDHLLAHDINIRQYVVA